MSVFGSWARGGSKDNLCICEKDLVIPNEIADIGVKMTQEGGIDWKIVDFVVLGVSQSVEGRSKKWKKSRAVGRAGSSGKGECVEDGIEGWILVFDQNLRSRFRDVRDRQFFIFILFSVGEKSC